MAIWDLTGLTETSVDNFARFTWEINNMTNGYLAMTILALVFFMGYFIIQQQGNTIWTASPISLLITAILATLMRIWAVDGVGMVTTTTVVILWVLTAIAGGIRMAIKE